MRIVKTEQSSSAELRVASTWDGRPAAPGEVVSVRLDANGAGLTLQVDAPFHGDPPPPGPPGPTPGLWEYEVVEVFIAGGPEGTDYLEIELSPHGHHLVLRLNGVRNPVEEELPLDYTAHLDRHARRWRGEARVPAAWLPPPPHRINAFAIHGEGSGRRYLAWHALPGDEPDFHQPRRFPTLDLEF